MTWPHSTGTVKPPAPAGPPPLFARYSQAQLIELGVGRPLLSAIGKITTEEQLLEFAECVPQLTADVLFALHDGASVEEVMEQVTAPVAAAEPVDPADYAAAAARPASLVTTDDETLQAILQGGFERWQVYLHPVQRRVVERSYSGPARVSGGPGTGKTIVALHRVRWLVQRLPSGSSGKDVLLTTFNKNLAADLRQRLLLLGGPELLDRVDVVNIDRLASQVVNEAQPGARLHLMDDDKAIELWREVLLELGETRWDAEFLHDEWSEVVLGHAITSRQEYFRTRRAGPRSAAQPSPARGHLGARRAVHQAAGRGEPVDVPAHRRARGPAGAAARRHPRAPVPAHRGGRGTGPELGALDAAASHGRPRAQRPVPRG